MKQIIKWFIIFICILFLLANIKYIHSITIWEDETDCMITYIDKYYPYGSTYMIEWIYPHIDKRNAWYEQEHKIYWCYIDRTYKDLLYNWSYCLVTLFYENTKWIIQKNRKWQYRG